MNRSWLMRVGLAVALLLFPMVARANATDRSLEVLLLDGTFRGAPSLSRYERAGQLCDWLYRAGDWAETLSAAEVAALRQEVEDLGPEMSNLGVRVSNLSASAARWRIQAQGRSLAEPDYWQAGESRSWAADRMAAVDAFWTNLSSPAMRLSVLVDATGRPGARPSRLPVDVMGSWTPPRPEDDFLLTRIDRGMAVSDLYVPGLGRDPGLRRAPVSARSIPLPSPSPFLTEPTPMALLLPTPILHPGFELPASTTPSLAGTRGFSESLFGSGRTGSLTAAELSLYRDLRLTARYDSNRVDVRNSFPWAALGQEPGFLSTSRRDLLSGVDREYTQLSTTFGYQVPRTDLRVDLRLNDFTSRPALAAPTFGTSLDVRMQDARLNLNYSLNPNLTVQGGYAYSRTSGTFAPSFTSPALEGPGLRLDDQHAYPYLGFDYKVSKNTRWNVNIRFYNTLDVTGAPRNPSFDLRDPALTTEVKVSF